MTTSPPEPDDALPVSMFKQGTRYSETEVQTVAVVVTKNVQTETSDGLPGEASASLLPPSKERRPTAFLGLPPHHTGYS